MCAHAVRVAVDDIEGVASVTVSLNDGLAVVLFSSENRAPIGQIRRAIRDNGFSPKDAEVRIMGMVEQDGGELFLRVPGAEERFRLRDHPDAAMPLAGDVDPGDVLVEGSIAESNETGTAHRVIRVRAIRPAGQPQP